MGEGEQDSKSAADRRAADGGDASGPASTSGRPAPGGRRPRTTQIRAAAVRLGTSAKQQARAVGQRWQTASGYDRARALIIAGYVVVFLGLLGFIVGTGEKEGLFRASAWYQVLDEEFHVKLENRSEDCWKDVRLTLNGVYELELDELLPATSRTVRLDRFRRPGCVDKRIKQKRRRKGKKRRKRHVLRRSGCAPPRGEAPRELHVRWSEGEARWPFPVTHSGAGPAREKP